MKYGKSIQQLISVFVGITVAVGCTKNQVGSPVAITIDPSSHVLLETMTDADLKNWPEAVHKLKQFEVEVVVPGPENRLDPGL